VRDRHRRRAGAAVRRPLIEGFARTVVRIGDSGAGQVCKACNQICVIANMLGVAEMVALCGKSGIAPEVVRSVLLQGSGRSNVMEVHALRLLQGSFTPGFRADLMFKDLKLAQDPERAHGVEAPVTSAAEPLFRQMMDEGMAAMDWTAIGTLLQRGG
jgi:2-hydroxy-3-oxopropionate reductase